MVLGKTILILTMIIIHITCVLLILHLTFPNKILHIFHLRKKKFLLHVDIKDILKESKVSFPDMSDPMAQSPFWIFT